MADQSSQSGVSKVRILAMGESLRSFALSRAAFLRQLWLRPLLAIVVLAVLGWFLISALERQLKANLESNLQTLLTADVAALRMWLKSEQEVALSVAKDAAVMAQVQEMIAQAADPDVSQLDLLKAAEQETLRSELRPHVESHGYHGYVVVNRQARVVASQRNDLIGFALSEPSFLQLLDRIWAGHTAVTRPAKSRTVLPDEDGQSRAGVPTMFAVAPVRAGPQGEIIAALGMRLRPQHEFSQLLGLARMGASGETYAFDGNGLLLSSSRFDEDLRRAGLLTEDAPSILNVSIRDPGVNLIEGQRSSQPRSTQPLTRMATAATAGKAGVDVEGYRDYRGVPVVGAWTWIDEYGLGVATELDQSEAYGALNLVRMAFAILFGLLTLTAIGIAIGTVFLQRYRRQAQKAALEARQLGQYTLVEKLGEGGMGIVYRAHHAMLHRPTAVKFLHPDKSTDEAIARFEREVQLTSKLTHPNTIAVYDYGRTPEGVFYYAMEFLDGLNLEKLVRQNGPLPDGRVIHLLRQACGSLAEAHEAGLIHRDIKPANLVVNARGGMFDVLKVLDFGLARAVDQRQQSRVTVSGVLAGTPLFMAPEAIDNPDQIDARSDLYALGAVAYYLLTGTAVFDGSTLFEILDHHRRTPPEPPSQRLGKPVSADLSRLILACLAKLPADRPASARVLATELAKCSMVYRWTEEDAAAWWSGQGLHSTIVSGDPGPATNAVGDDATALFGR